MSLSSSLSAGVSGLIAQGARIASISDNISNLNTTGYKSTDVSFSNLVGNGLTAGGVAAGSKRAINGQGLIQRTGTSTDIAINGRGFFIVNTNTGNSGDFLYTRAGSFDVDNSGFLRNDSGFYLQGWKLDSEGRLPGETGNPDTTANSLLESTEAVNITSLGGVASATTKVSLGLNLDASQEIRKGAGPGNSPASSPGEIPTTDATNSNMAGDQIILSTGGLPLTVGDVLTLTTGGGLIYNYTYGGFETSADISGGILGASTPTGIFTGATDGDNFTIQTTVNGSPTTFTFTFQTAAPNPDLGTFNSLQTLSDAINSQTGLTARVNGNFMYVAPEDSEQGLTFTDVTGTFAAALGLTTYAGATNTFNSFESLNNVINASAGVSARVIDTASDAKIEITVDSPLETLQITSTASRINDKFNIPTTAYDPIYNAAGIGGGNMTSGVIPTDFIRNMRVFDSLGTGHDFRIGFIKSGANQWLVEIWAANDNEIVTNTGPTKNQVAVGAINFNGDGTLRSVSSTLTTAIEVNWINKASTSNVVFDFGTAGPIAGTIGATEFGQTNGLSQFDGPFNARFVNSNGAETGNLRSIDFTEEGFLVANFSNGQSIRVYKLPIADFTNINGLNPLAGNVFSQTEQSGDFNLKEAGQGGTGKISPASLESTNVELADQLTKMIVAQRGYQANTKVISTTDDLLDELNRI